MQSDTNMMTVTPPRLISSIAAGFNTVANHIYLILFPIALDMLLWFGPHLRVKTLFEPFVNELNMLLAHMTATNTLDLVNAGKEFWTVFLDRFNMFSLLRVYPVGITSLFSSSAPISTPLGDAPVYEMGSLLGFALAWLILVLVGMAGGSLFFSEIARCNGEERQGFSLRRVGWQLVQILLLTIALVIILLVFTIPTSLMLSVLLMFSPGLAQISLFFLSLLLLWLLVPLVFAPHGVFVFRQNVLSSMRTSMQLVRYFLPGTGLFLLVALLIGQGMDIIWRVPNETSWMALVGVFGHAFVTTGLLSASFIYYLGGIRWMQDRLRQISTKGARA